PLLTYVNYAVHLDNVGGVQISADMPATVARMLAEVKGPDMVTLYTTGTCGDVNHLNVNWGVPQKGFDNAARMGIILAAQVLRTVAHLKPVEVGPPRSKSQTVQLPLAKIEPGDIEKAREILSRRDNRQAKPPTILETVGAFKVLDVAAREGKPHE